MAVVETDLKTFVAERLVARNPMSRALFDREADRLAAACEEMAQRFLRGGRLIAFGRGASATDAQHVAVEFVHPVIVGKRALPALDVSAAFERWLPAIVCDSDIVMGFCGPAGDQAIAAALENAHASGAQTFALPGARGHFAIEPPSNDVFVSQELIEILYHTLWETVHVFFEHRERGHDDVGASAFLYPFLGGARQDTSAVVGHVASSIRAKAIDDERLREAVARDQADAIAAASAAVLRRIDLGATLLIFGNGGSATDAMDVAADLRAGGRPALDLTEDAAILTAIANDIGVEEIFQRQVIAYGRTGDALLALSTSGNSGNVIAALEEARKRDLVSVAMVGYDGGRVASEQLADQVVITRSQHIPRIQEAQASAYHALRTLVEQ